MFTYLLLYVTWYFISVIHMFIYIHFFKLNNNFSQYYFSTIWSLNNSYLNNSWILKIILLQFSGLPPFFLFFVKLFFITNSFFYLNVISIVLIFLNLLLGMFFYLKIFTNTNYFISNSDIRNFSNQTILNSIKRNYNKTIFNYYFFLITFFFLNIFSFFFIIDILVILLILVGNIKPKR